jgi:putative transposase
MRYRIIRIPGATYFFTVVTHQRAAMFADPKNAELFHLAVSKVQLKHSFIVEASVILPDHIHVLWTLPEGDSDYSKRWRLIKETFTRSWFAVHSLEISQRYRSTAGAPLIWQKRFWEHLIRDERDFALHVDYIHFNPVKHGFAGAPKDWPHSTFREWVAMGSYDLDWATDDAPKFPDDVGSE